MQFYLPAFVSSPSSIWYSQCVSIAQADSKDEPAGNGAAPRNSVSDKDPYHHLQRGRADADIRYHQNHIPDYPTRDAKLHQLLRLPSFPTSHIMKITSTYRLESAQKGLRENHMANIVGGEKFVILVGTGGKWVTAFGILSKRSLLDQGWVGQKV